MLENKIYLDYQASTPLDKRVLSAMLPYMDSFVGNPMSKHWAGYLANEAIEESRDTIAGLLDVDPAEIIFTSGATESINLLLKGMARGLRNKGNHIITSTIEHKAVLETCGYLEKSGFEISYVGVNSDGFISMKDLEKLIRTDTIIVAIGHANNEIGVIQNLDEISSLVKSKGIHLFSDCAQSLGKVDFEFNKIDSFAFSGHKIYGPMGIGGLHIRRQWQDHFTKSIYGGGQEYWLRPGTQNVPAIVGLAEACKIAWDEMTAEKSRTKKLRDSLWTKIKTELPDAELNGGMNDRLCGNINFSIPGIESDLLIKILSDQFSFSAGSACMSGTNEPSHVISAIGKNYNLASSALRISLGRYTTQKEINTFAKSFVGKVQYLKNLLEI